MNKFVKCVALIFLTSLLMACNKPEKTANAESPEVNLSVKVELPRFQKDEDYGSVREKMLAAGWTPLISPDADQCNEGDERCENRPEMESCSGSGMANCKFLWAGTNRNIAICTTGESAIFDNICDDGGTGHENNQSAHNEDSKTNLNTSEPQNIKYEKGSKDVALQCHYKDPRSANSWIYLVASQKHNVHGIFEDKKDGSMDMQYKVNDKTETGNEIIYDVVSISNLMTKKFMPSNFDESDYEKFSVDRSTLDAELERYSKKVSGKSNYQFACDILDSQKYNNIIALVLGWRAEKPKNRI